MMVLIVSSVSFAEITIALESDAESPNQSNSKLISTPVKNTNSEIRLKDKLKQNKLKKEKVKPATVINKPLGASDFFQVILGLGFVLVSIIVLVWIMKKLNRFSLSKNDQLQVVAAINVGSREKVIVLQVGETQILLGITPNTINSLHVLDKALPVPEKNEIFANGFPNKLLDALKKKER